MKKIRIDAETQLRVFEDWGDFTKQTEQPSEMPRNKRGSRDSDHAWAGGSFEQAITRAKTGWPEGRNEFVAMAERLKDALQSEIDRPTLEWDVTGDWVDIDAYLQGQPENMIHHSQTPANREMNLTITVDLCQSSMVSADSIIRRGVGIAALIDLLECAGFSTEVIAVLPIEVSKSAINEVTEFQIPIKRNGQPMDIDLMGYSLVSPTVLRRLVFSIMEQEPQAFRKAYNVGHGYGYPKPNRTVLGKTSQLHISNSDGMVSTFEKTEEWVKGHLKALGALREEVTA